MTPKLTLEGLAEWLETQPPERTYDYWACSDCLWMRYFKYLGFSEIEPVYCRLMDAHPTWQEIACDTPWTYGAALDRAREALDG